MSEQIVIKELRPIEQIDQVYSGKPGCACGCRGTYYPANEQVARQKGYWTDDDKANKVDGWKRTNRMIKKVYNLFLKNLETGKIYSWEAAQKDFVCFTPHGDRTYTIYFEKEGTDD